MLSEPEKSRSAYWLAAALAVGLIAAWFVLNRAAPPLASAAAPPSLDPTPVTSTATLKEAEEYFQKWGGYLVWENDLAEFAMWSPVDRDYTVFFEVRHVNGSFAFRRLAKLTRPLIDHGTSVQCPLAFTETEAMRAAFYRANPNFKPTPRTWSSTARSIPDLPPKPPERVAVGNPPKPTPPTPLPGAKLDPRVGASIARGSGLIVEYIQAVAQARLSSPAQLQDLLALFQLHPITPLSENPTSAELATAIEERKTANEGIATMATALMPAKQLEVFRAVLARDVAKLEARRR